MIKSVALTFALVASSAQAGFVHTDWKYTGDEEAVLHEETGIEWLTMLNSQTNTVADTNTQLQDGYYYDGWRYATLEEVDIMMSDFFGEAMDQYSVSGDDTLMKAQSKITFPCLALHAIFLAVILRSHLVLHWGRMVMFIVPA